MKMNRGLVRQTVSGCAVLVAVAAPAVALGQACIGSPAGYGTLAVTGAVGFPDGAKSYGVGAVYNLEGPVAVFGNYSLMVPDAEGLKNLNTFGGGAALELVPRNPGVGVLSACPVVSASYLSTEQSFLGETFSASSFSVPLGFGVGATLPLGESATTLTPFAVPQFIYSRATVKGFGESESDSDTFFGLSAGATLGLGSVFLVGDVSKLFEEGSKAVFKVGAGLFF